ncbi:MAG: hypothetical protein RIQ72_201 [Candidatus Parcubacteria bacterium]
MSKKKSSPYISAYGGFIQIIVVIIIGLVLLRLIGVNIVEWLNTPAVKDFSLYVRDMLKAVWADLKSIVTFFFKL